MHPSFAFSTDDGQRLEELLAGLQGASLPGWRPHRIIFRNFWFFDKEEFLWHHGRLFLGGQNAAGKSTVLSMAVPLLLDGNKSEERLNTFGGQGRHMAYYVTGSANADDRSEAAYQYPARISYLALEFYRPRDGKGDENGERKPTHLTFGQGLQHDRAASDKSVRSWGFVIRDGRRIGRDGFDLLKENGTSLPRADLKRLLAEGGELFDTNREYKREVNRLLFGFKDLADFDALIELLLQIRRPKLTKEVRPKDVAEILTKSLPPLDEGVMQVTAQSLDHIDQTTQNIEKLNLEIEAANAVEKATQTVYRRLAEVAAARFEQAAEVADRAVAKLAETEANLAEQQAALTAAQTAVAQAEATLAELAAERQALEQHDALQAAEKLNKVAAQIATHEAELTRLTDAIAEAERRLTRLKREREAAEGSWHDRQEEGLAGLASAAEAAQAARWPAAEHWAESLMEHWRTLRPGQPEADLTSRVPRASVAAAKAERLAQIKAIEGAIQQREAAQSRWQQAKGREEQALHEFMQAEAAATTAANLLSDQREATVAALEDWAATSPLSPNLAPLREQVSRFSYGQTARSVIEPLRPLLDEATQAINEAEGEQRLTLNELKQARAEHDAERQRLQRALPEPPRSAEQEQARAALKASGIPFAPLFELIDFRGEGQPEIEQALLEMGLLDALVVPLEQQAQAVSLITAKGLSERFIALAPQETAAAAEAPAEIAATAQAAGPTTTTLAKLLTVEADHPLSPAAEQLLQRLHLNGPGIASISAGHWQQGLLTGATGPAETIRYVGRSSRERFRQAELARLAGLIAEIDSQIDEVTAAIAELQHQRTALQADWRKLEELPELAALSEAAHGLHLRQGQVQERRGQLDEARAKAEAARQQVIEAENRLVPLYREFPPAEGLDLAGLQQLAQWTHHVEREFADIHRIAQAVQDAWRTLALLAEHLDSVEAQLDDHLTRRDETDVALRTLKGQERALEQILAQPDVEALFDRLREIDTERPKVEAARKEADRTEAVATDRVNRLRVELPEHKRRAETAVAQATSNRQALAEAVNAYPTLENQRFEPADDQAARQVAAILLNRWQRRPSLIQDLEKELVSDHATLAKRFEEQRPTLRDYYPELNPEAKPIAQFNYNGKWLTPYALLADLQSQQLTLREVLQQREVELFERHLLQDVGREVRRSLLKAKDWVASINKLLEAYPIRNDERVWLDWSPKETEHELGGTIARQAGLLWLDEADLTPAQRDALKSAFQDEIDQIRQQAKRGEWRADLFRERLAEVLDHRTWFRFRIFVRGGVSGRQEISETVHNARSGSERALVLLLPLLAALSVRYDQASGEAPRLLALDEGFAGIDAVNSRQLIRFLTALDLTWVVSSEKQPALTADLPGASLYNMLREGTVVACRPFIWDGATLHDPEAPS